MGRQQLGRVRPGSQPRGRGDAGENRVEALGRLPNCPRVLGRAARLVPRRTDRLDLLVFCTSPTSLLFLATYLSFISFARPFVTTKNVTTVRTVVVLFGNCVDLLCSVGIVGALVSSCNFCYVRLRTVLHVVCSLLCLMTAFETRLGVNDEMLRFV